MASILPADGLAVGMQLPIQSQSTMYAEAWEATAGAAELGEIAAAAEQANFWYLAVCNHVAIPRSQARAMGTEWWDTVALLGWLAGITDRVKLLSHISVLPFAHPLSTAKAWSTLDTVSGGRMILGVGTGHSVGEFEALGVDFHRRGALLDEAIDAVRACFSDEYPAVEGPTWSFSDVGQKPRPVQPGGPPIWVGGSSKRAMRRAAERGDGWLPQGPVTPEDVAFITAHRKRLHGDSPIDLGALVGPVYVGTPTWDVGQCISGPAEKVAHILRKFPAMGIGHVQVRLRSRSSDELIDQIETFGGEVMPLLNY